MRITKKFKQLTKFTYPYETEHRLIKHLPVGYKEDGLGNWYIEIGNKPSTMFTCHLDTACGESQRVNHVIEGDFIKTDGKTILGADDKAGMVILLYMIEKKIPGLYYFFIGEERGCIGSSRLASTWKDKEFSKYITKVISFDRRGTDSIITEQIFERCCSDGFANALALELNLINPEFKFSPDPTGIYTDSAEFMSLVPECTNISVGYYNEHSVNEKQDIQFLIKLCSAVCRVNWEGLPVTRDPGVNTKSYFNEDDWSSWDDDDDDDIWDVDNYSYFRINGKVEKMTISKSQIMEESSIIENWLKSSSMYQGFKSISWNGNELYVETDNFEFVGNRTEIMEFVEDLSSVSIDSLKPIKSLD